MVLSLWLSAWLCVTPVPQEGNGNPAEAPKPAEEVKKDTPPPDLGPPLARGREMEVERLLHLPRPKFPQVAPSYRVLLKMKTGRRFWGLVIRDQRFSNCVQSGRHIDPLSPAYRSPDTFMLRFVDGLDGDMLTTWDQLSKLEVKEILDVTQVKEIEQSFERTRIAESESARMTATKEEQPAKDVEETETETKESNEEASAEKVEEAPVPALLLEFSPNEGWSPERKSQIERRRIVVGVFPDEREKRFLDVFAEWLPLYEDAARAQKEREKDERARMVKLQEQIDKLQEEQAIRDKAQGKKSTRPGTDKKKPGAVVPSEKNPDKIPDKNKSNKTPPSSSSSKSGDSGGG